jgi:hypothetical protein
MTRIPCIITRAASQQPFEAHLPYYIIPPTQKKKVRKGKEKLRK